MNLLPRSLVCGILCTIALLGTETRGQKATCRQRPMDIVFVIDGSRSVRPKNFQIVLEAVKDMVDTFEAIGPDATQIGLIQYSSRVRQEFALNQYNTKDDVKNAIDNIEFMEMGTMTGEALKYLVTKTFTTLGGARMNGDAIKVAVVITDGRSQDRTVEMWADRAKNSGITLFAIGVGRRISDKDLLMIASEPKEDHKFSVKRFESIRNVDVMLSEEICDIDECEHGMDNCSQICRNTEGSYLCDCNDGYRLEDDRSTCVLYDPCRDASCAYKCEPAPSDGYRCVCPPNHRLNRDEKSCYELAAPVPVDLTFSEMTHTSMRVAWQLDNPRVADDVTHYTVRYSRADGLGERKTVNVEDPTIVLTDLEPGTLYTVEVSSVTAYDTSNSVSGEESTLFLGETTLTLSNPTLSTLTARWQPAGGDLLSGYDVHYTKVPDGSGVGVSPDQERSFKVGPGVHELVLRDLEPGTEYRARVTPLHGKLKGGVGTDTETTRDLSRPKVTFTKTTLTSANIEWSDIGTDAESYDVEFYPIGKPELKQVISTKSRDLTLTDLDPDTEYAVHVVGHVTDDGKRFSSPIGSAKGKTKPIPLIRANIPKTSFTTADIEWTDIGVDEYTLRIHETDSPDNVTTFKFDGDQTAFTAEGLTPDTDYTVIVVGRLIQDGRQFASHPAMAEGRTKPLSPLEVTIPKTTLSTADVEWTDIDVDSYSVLLAPTNPGEGQVQVIDVEGDKTSTKFRGLNPDTDYTATVIGRLTRGEETHDSSPGSASGRTKRISAPIVNIPQTTLSTLNAEWTDIGVDLYTVSIHPVEDPEDIKTIEVEGDNLQTTFSDLTPDTEYTVTVVGSIREDGKDFLSPQGSDDGTTKRISRPIVIVPKTTLSTLDVEWTDIGVDSYTISIHPKDDPENVKTIEVGGDDLTATFHDLVPHTEYTVTVVGSIHDDEKVFQSPPGSTDGTTKRISPPTVIVPKTTLSTLDVEWTDIGVDSYTVSIHPKDDPEDVETIEVGGDDLKTTFRDLSPATDYTVTVVGTIADDGKDFKSHSGSADGTTETLTPPDVDITETSLSTADVMWTQSGIYPQYFTVSYCPTYNPDDKKTLKVEDISTKLHDLEPDTEYMVNVIGHVYDDDKLFSSEPGSDTDKTKTLIAPKVTSKPRSLTSATIRWDGIGLPADHYVVTYCCPAEEPEDVQMIMLEGNANMTILRGLAHDAEYDVTVVGYVVEEEKEFPSPAGMSTFTLGALDPPEVKIPSSTTTTLDATWMHDVDAESYVLMIKTVETTDFEKRTITVSGEVTEITFPSLIPATEYMVTVVANVADEGMIIVSPPGSTNGYTKPAPPQNLKVPVRDVTKLVATFEPSEGGSDWYEATCVPAGGNPEDYEPQKIDEDDLTILCEGLLPAAYYDIYIVNIFREMRSEVVKITTVTVVGPPMNFDLSQPTTHTILASWQPPADVVEVTEYILRYSSVDHGTVNEIQIPGGETSVILIGLHPNTLYEGTIRAIIGAVQSPSASDSETTLPDDIMLKVIDTGYTNITVSWPRSKVPHVTSYTLTYVPQREGENSPDTSHLLMSVTLEPDVTEYVITNAKPATIYDLTLQFIYPLGRSEIATAEATTLAPPPGPLLFSNNTVMGFAVAWGRPMYEAKPKGYTVSYVPAYGETVIEVEVPSGQILDLGVEDLEMQTLYNVSVVANYHYDITSEPSVGQDWTLAPLADLSSCDCHTYMNAQNQMQSTLERLVLQIEKLNRKIDGLQSASPGDELNKGRRMKRK